MPHLPATILVVDDHATNQQVLGSLLSKQGYEVVVADCGEKAVEHARTHRPELILLDLILPGMNGREVNRALKAEPSLALIPVIFLTAALQQETMARVLHEGAVDYILKPFDPPELLGRVRTQVSLCKARRELEAIAEERNRLMAVLAHDLRNPLAAIRLGAHLLGDGDRPPSPEHMRELCHSMNEATATMESLIERHLVAAREARRIQKLDLRSGDLGELVAMCRRLQSSSAVRKEIALQSLYDTEGDFPVRSDPLALRQVIENLLSNAIKFSPHGKTVRIDIRDEGTAWRVLVMDEGPGLQPEDHERLWTAYARLSAQPTADEPSTGLGLSIVQELVELLGGECGCDSVPGKGATFWVRIPRDGPRSVAAQSSAVGSPRPRSREHAER